MIAIVDYGVGNLFSLQCSLGAIGAEAVVTGDPEVIAGAKSVILPGVGAFRDAAEKLREHGLDQAVLDGAGKGKPLLGICLGMQMLYETSGEYGLHRGLGLVPGGVESLAAALREEPSLKVPHMGWNDLELLKPHCPLLRYTREGDYVYYVHSFFAPASEYTAAASRYGGVRLTGMVWRENVYGTQFHPEKSGETGLRILRAFAEL